MSPLRWTAKRSNGSGERAECEDVMRVGHPGEPLYQAFLEAERSADYQRAFELLYQLEQQFPGYQDAAARLQQYVQQGYRPAQPPPVAPVVPPASSLRPPPTSTLPPAPTTSAAPAPFAPTASPRPRSGGTNVALVIAPIVVVALAVLAGGGYWLTRSGSGRPAPAAAPVTTPVAPVAPPAAAAPTAPPATPTASKPALAVMVVDQRLPERLRPLEQRGASITVRNTGTATWTREGAGQVKLSTLPANRPSAFHTPGQWPGPSDVALLSVDQVNPGEEATFTFTLSAFGSAEAAAEKLALVGADGSPVAGSVLTLATKVQSETLPAVGAIGPGTPKWAATWQRQAPVGSFNKPSSVAVDAKGRVVVLDQGNARIQIFDPQGKPLGAWGTRGANDGQFDEPDSLALDRQGNVYVADTGNNRVQKFDGQGRFLAKWGG
ncbi:MAG: hypothetical protein HY329_09135, partial [Chloroflexi bacterium]|nr:hypothetical protein [Chloroflexota bacterium]